MHLKRLEISGFKSFADNIKLDLEPGITAIVGPNGCGKSNIIDAVRWCLGEMSAKSLRSNLMLDVVFNGSGSRPPQNMAEVTLTFDNSDKRLPIDFTDVSISRRLFRSGESEYFINKTQCRLRDIKELFLDTGMGEDGYSSLEQGKVEWILQAKPEERRELFEEAAGVSKYRARREEALRKLEKVEIDLSRLADIVLVTQDQIRKLENAVNKAKTYQRIKEELRTMEVNDWLYQLSTSSDEVTRLRQHLDEIQKTAEELNTQSHQKNTEISEYRLTLTQLEEELLQANSKLNTIESNMKIGEERLNASLQREQDCVTQRVHTQDNLAREELRVNEVKEQHVVQAKALEELKTVGANIDGEFAQYKSVFDNAQLELENKKKAVKDLRDLILSRSEERSLLQQQLGGLSSEMARLMSQLENCESEKSRIEAQLDLVNQEAQIGENQVAELKTQLSIKANHLEDVTGRIVQAERQEKELRQQILSQTEEIAKLQGQIHSIRDQHTLDPYLSGVQAVLSMGFPGINGPVGKLFQTEEINRDIVAATIGEHLGDLVADTLEDAHRAVEFLREEGKGRVRIWVLEKLSQAPSDDYVASLANGNPLVNCIQADEKFRPLLNHLCSSAWLQGTTVYGRAFINGGIDPSQWKSHIPHRLPELESALSSKEGVKVQLEHNLASLDQGIKELVQEKETAVKEMEEARIRLQLALENLSRIAHHKQMLEQERDASQLNASRLIEDKQKAQQREAECTVRFNQLQSEEKLNHDQLDQLQHELTELQHTYAKASVDLSGQEERRNAFQEKLNWQLSILEHNERETANLNQSIERYRKSIDEMSAQQEQAVAAQIEAKKMIETSLGERQQAAEACASIQSKRAEVTDKVQLLDVDLSKIRSELSTLQETIQNEMIQEATLKSRIETVTQKLFEQYELSLEAAKLEFVTPVAAEVEALEKLKKRVANMGPINLAAPQEHAELVEKNTFMTTQQEDLLKAREDLKQVIAKINATTRDHFRETFEKVRENFRGLYGKLFQGGEADLRFTDETDILNTGVDIFCQPPGKKLLHISLLSGGEKALTAIALLFAFFQVRPSPVALLDEVDAPLDEANVLRYVDMIKVFSEKSQFLLISHNKRTMEAANTLYGVTMEELGVSKVLSARLAKKQMAAEATAEATPA